MQSSSQPRHRINLWGGGWRWNIEKGGIFLLPQHLLTAGRGVWFGQDGDPSSAQVIQASLSHIVHLFPACFSPPINFALFKGNTLVCHLLSSEILLFEPYMLCNSVL